MVSFPTSLDALTNPTGSDKTNSATVPHATQHANANDILEALEAKVGIGSYTPARNKALIGGSSGSIWDATARKNRLINGCMRVNQRVTMPTADDSYCLDRWVLLLEAANAATVAQETSDVPTDGSKRALKLTVGSANNNKFGIVSILEFLDCADLRGKTVSLQLKMKSTAGITNVRAAVIEWTSTADVVTSDVVGTWGAENTNPTLATNWAYCSGYTPISLAATTSWATYRIEGVSVGASTNNLAVFIWVDDETTTQTTDVLRITDVQLEGGAVCTDVERRPFAQELALCMRYYEKTYKYNTAPGTTTQENAVIFIAHEDSTARPWYVTQPWRVEKRVQPTVVGYDEVGNAGKVSTYSAALVRTDNTTNYGTGSAPSTRVLGFFSTGVADAGISFHVVGDAEL